MFWTRSGDLIVMAVLGGMGTVFGPVIGAIALLVLEEALPVLIGGASQLLTGHEVQGAREYWQLILGPMLLLIVLFARGGIDGMLARPPREVKGHG
jgi:branched-chain amino acid transport system permease protein